MQQSSADDIAAQQKLVEKADAALNDARTALFAAQLKEKQAEDALEKHKSDIMEAMNRSAAAANDRTRLQTMKEQMATRAAELRQSAADMAETEQRLIRQTEEARALLQQ